MRSLIATAMFATMVAPAMAQTVNPLGEPDQVPIVAGNSGTGASGGSNAATVRNNPRLGGLDQNGASGQGLVLTDIQNNGAADLHLLNAQGHHYVIINTSDQ